VDLVAQLNASLVGRYAIDREIGRGGMATVYLARDLRHDRRVALKVLSPELGAVVGVDRFLAEIKVTAGLQHPNLLPLFDSGEAEGHLFYVMPFVQGESLRARLAREKQLPVDEALRITTAIASALDYAHRHGIIHRDLKPENILLHEGQPLVADFGIALAVSNAGGNRITQTGISLGTPQYMSPEQATGDRSIDGRTDLYSLGAMLYEMLVGDPPYLGSTSQAIIAKVLTERPQPVRSSRPSVPAHVEAAVTTALEKLPADRFATAQELADALAGKRAVVANATDTANGLAPVSGPPWRALRKDAVYSMLLVIALAFGVTEWREARRGPSLPVVRLAVNTSKTLLFNDKLPGTNVVVAPDGDRIAYFAVPTIAYASQLFVHDLSQMHAKPLSSKDVTVAIRNPCFSPDGKWLAYTDGYDIKKVSVDDGSPVRLGTVSDEPLGLSWSTTGRIVVGSATMGLFVIPERAGKLDSLVKAPDDESNRYPIMLPDGKSVVYAATRVNAPPNLFIRSLDGDKPTPLQLTGTPIGYVAGRLIFANPGGAVMAVALDPAHRATTGTPAAVGEDVITDATFGVKASISASGMFVYRSGKSETLPVLARGSALTSLNVEPGDFSQPRYSPDGQRIAFTVTTRQGTEIYVLNRAHGRPTLVASKGTRPEWTPDGKRILFVFKGAFWSQSADGSGAPTLLYTPAEGAPANGIVSPDGKWLVYLTGNYAHPPRSVFAVRLDEKAKSIQLVSDTSYNQMPRLSPDGHWLAYQTNKSGRYEVYIRPFPEYGGSVQVSRGDASEPVWAHDGHTLYFRTPQGIIGVPVTLGAAPGIGEQKVVVTGDFVAGLGYHNFDISPDGEFVMLRWGGDDETRTIVVQNWVKELIARTGAPH
jgi:serine/threonine protein kinase/Tol biopolymer transport system component